MFWRNIESLCDVSCPSDTHSSPLFFCAQVVAITVFFLLTVAYYAFFAPFLGKDIYEYVAIGVYSILVSSVTPHHQNQKLKIQSLAQAFLSLSNCLNLDFQALAVFILYVRCTAIDPADPGILVEADKTLSYKANNDTDTPG